MHLAHLSLHDFRSYTDAEVALAPGVAGFFGPNGHGKTNLVEAVHYTATQTSHRVATDAPLVRDGAERAVVRGQVVRDGRHALVELEINPGRSNRARLNRAPVPRAREALGVLRTVLFAPEDLALIKGEPGERRRFLDDLLVARAPRFAGVRADYDRVLRQRSSLLKTAGVARRAGTGDAAAATLDVWDAHLARAGAELLAARLELAAALEPLVQARYAAVAGAAAAEGSCIGLRYRASVALPSPSVDREAAVEVLLDEIGRRREEEVERGVCLVGPHRDDVVLRIGPLPAKGYASQGECWSLALALRLASYDLLSADGERPVLVLDDVFAELDAGRRDRLAELAADAEQVLVTAAVPADVPAGLVTQRFDVRDGSVRRAG